MQNVSRNGSSVDRSLGRLKLGKKRNKRLRQCALESLENRVVMSYVFSYNPFTHVASAVGSNAQDALGIEAVNGYLEHSVNGSTFSPNWGPYQVPAKSYVAVDITVSGKDGSSVALGTADYPASDLNATFYTVAGTNKSDFVTIDDSGGTTPATGSYAYDIDTYTGTVTGPGINYNQSGSQAFEGGVALYGSSETDTYNVSSVVANEPFSIITGATGTSTVNVGKGGTVSGIQGPLAIFGGPTTININDQKDTTSTYASLDNNSGSTNTPYEVTGLSPAPIEYGAGVTNLNVYGGTAGVCYTVSATQAGTLAELFNGGNDTVDISDLGSVANILGPVQIDNVGYNTGTNLTVDASADTTDHTMNLSGGTDYSTLSGLAPADIYYNNLSLNSLTINTGPSGTQALTVDFTNGDPVPIPWLSQVPGLSFNGGADSSSSAGSHQLILVGENTSDEFTSETYNAEDPNALPQPCYTTLPPFFGDIQLTDSLSNCYYIEYTGIQPVYDIVPVSTYAFNDYGIPDQSFTATDGGPFLTAAETIEFASTPPSPTGAANFATTYIANKGNVTFNTPSCYPTSGIIGVVNIPTASDGLISLTFNVTDGGNDIVSFINDPDITGGTAFNDGPGNDVTNVMGNGIPLTSFMDANGGGGMNTLNYDADGETPTIQPDGKGGIIITIPGYGPLDAINYQTVNITGAGKTGIVAGSPTTINTVEGFQTVNAITGTFTVTQPVIIIPTAPDYNTPTPLPVGPPASDFVATIDWGDPSPDLDAGTITQDAENPNVYYITGTHTYAENGTYTVTNTVEYIDGTSYNNKTLVPGINITVGFVAGTTTVLMPPSTANVTQGTLAVSVFPIVGTEGLPIAPAPIATFIDAGGAGPIGDYVASISVIDAAGNTVVGPIMGTVTENGNAAQYTVGSPGFTLPEEGTYQVVVSITDSAGVTPITVEGASLAVIADAPLSAGAPVALAPNTGVLLPVGTVVGNFTDANTGGSKSDFTAIIDWGDGSPDSIGTIAGSDGTYTVDAPHIYAKPGTFDTTIIVTDVGGSEITLTGTATVTDLALIQLTAPSFTSTEGLPTGTFVLFTFVDPNTLATVADVNAQLAANGWGDGSPTTGGANLVVQEIGVTPLTAATNPGDPIFEVLGDHTYLDTTPALTPNILTVDVTTLGGVSTTLTDPPGGGVTVIDARLTSSNGTEITGLEGATTGTELLGSFTDQDPTGSLSDFTATVAWGSTGTGSTVTITQPGGVGTPFLVSGSFIYPEEGTYAYTVTIDDTDGQSTTFSGSAIIADAPLFPAPPQPTVTQTQPAVAVGYPLIFDEPVAYFTDANPSPASGGSSTIADFTATIDWGDGTPPSAGTITQPGGPDTMYVVSGSHTYASTGPTGTYPIQVFVVDTGGSRLTIDNTATVTAPTITLTGMLNPASDSGKSDTDDITNVTQPNFIGTATPNSLITLYETPYGGGTTVVIGTGAASASGAWSITSSVLAQGTYTITASATDQFGMHPTSAVVITPKLVIDTTPPVITALSFDRFDATLTVTFQDNLSGMDLQSITNSAFYHISAKPLASDVPVPKTIVPTQILYTPGALPTDPVVVTVVFNRGLAFRGGKYEVIIDSGTGNSGIQDVAGNALSGNFYGTFPTGDGLPGGDFVADISTFHNKVLPFIPVRSGFSPPPAGIDPPAGSTVKHKKGALVNTGLAVKKAAKLKALDEALSELVATSKTKD